MPKEQYMCQLCANHGIFNQPKRGHKQQCKYNNCRCDLCALNTQRRALDQLERELKIPEDKVTISPGPSPNETLESQTSSVLGGPKSGILGKRRSTAEESIGNKCLNMKSTKVDPPATQVEFVESSTEVKCTEPSSSQSTLEAEEKLVKKSPCHNLIYK